MTINSEEIARSVHTHPVVIRRIVSQLTRHGLVEVQRGQGGGFRLTRPPAEISLHDIYAAIESGPLFQVPALGEDHLCGIGREIGPVLGMFLEKAEGHLVRGLQSITLADVIETVRQKVCKGGPTKCVDVTKRK